MPFNWENFLDFAKLLSQASDEASHRTAISRAYYAAFNIARVRLSNRGIVTPQGVSSHDFIWEQYRSNYGIDGDNIEITGQNLKRMRVNADYKKNATIDFRYVDAAIVIAETLIQEIKKLPPI